MNRIVLAAAALIALAAPASAQYYDYYGGRGSGWYEGDRGGYYGRRGYGRSYEEDYPPRRYRQAPPPPAGRYGGAPGRLGTVCVTARATCPHPAVPAGTACGCATGAGTFHGTVQ